MTEKPVAAKNGEKFVEKRQFFIPRQHFVLIKLSRKRLEKMAKWYKNGDDIGAHILKSTGELLLINDTMNAKWRRKKNHD